MQLIYHRPLIFKPKSQRISHLIFARFFEAQYHVHLCLILETRNSDIWEENQFLDCIIQMLTEGVKGGKYSWKINPTWKAP